MQIFLANVWLIVKWGWDDDFVVNIQEPFIYNPFARGNSGPIPECTNHE